MIGEWVDRIFGWLPAPWIVAGMGRLGKRLDNDQLVDVLRRLAAARADSLPSGAEALRFLLQLDGRLYALQGRQAVRHGQGLHVKHRLMNYHDFFVARLIPGERVLDVGCGNGALTCDMGARGGCQVLGVELEAAKIADARRDHAHPNVVYQVGDATALTDGQGAFDVVTLSNVLEHLQDRPAFLRRLVQQATPSRLLIRVPLFDREWRVPLKRELGVEWRLDPTHETEYTQESFLAEMNEAGLTPTHLEIRWGEIWAEVRPDLPERSEPAC
ncbi:MAG: class I SAM-dependent methyltransferase [Magnetococcales bacterium]|nr:class I SAM-dependent methyltransferase [Magnetococcales bacterium]